MDWNELTKLILYAVAMGVAATVLSMLGESQAEVPKLLGIAVFCLAVAGLNTVKTRKL